MMNAVDHKKRDAKKIEKMFSRIASRYDLLNHVLSFGLDIMWRREAARETGRINCSKILDVCTGTGDMAIELCRFWEGKVSVEGIDFSSELLGIGNGKVKKAGLDRKITFTEGNAEKLPYRDEQYDAVTIIFGLRNISNRLKALKEFYRVTKPEGCFICLEFSQPTNLFVSKIYPFYLTKLLPLVSKILGSDPAAYRYLCNTIKDFPLPEDLALLIESAGWRDVEYRKLANGIVAIHSGRK
jgi:demethylmenaquinone methyltransferase / 2-methoxy-6-polyprenyl-1,4-benzoquinol methylase